MENRENSTTKATFILSLIIAVLCAVIIFLLVRNPFGKSQKESNFFGLGNYESIEKILIGPVDEAKAQRNVDSFRTLGLNGNGIYYDTSELGHYIRDAWPAIVHADSVYIKKHTNLHIDDFVWKVGCYFMFNKDADNKVKVDFCFAPILVNKNNNRVVYDYFGPGKEYYDHGLTLIIPNETRTRTTGDGSSGVYNTGTMFP